MVDAPAKAYVWAWAEIWLQVACPEISSLVWKTRLEVLNSFHVIANVEEIVRSFVPEAKLKFQLGLEFAM